MKVRAITIDGDWTFGKGKANYIRSSKAVRQRVVTRLRSFTDDWFLDINAGLPWLQMLGSKNIPDEQIIRKIETVVLTTEGVRSIEQLELTRLDPRNMRIELTFIDFFDETYTESVTLL